MKHATTAALALALALAGCSAQQQQSACATFRDAESNPLVQLAVAGGAAATGGTAGIVVSSIKAFGDAYCTAGPPPGDVTSTAQQEAWLLGQVTAPMLKAAGVK